MLGHFGEMNFVAVPREPMAGAWVTVWALSRGGPSCSELLLPKSTEPASEAARKGQKESVEEADWSMVIRS